MQRQPLQRDRECVVRGSPLGGTQCPEAEHILQRTSISLKTMNRQAVSEGQAEECQDITEGRGSGRGDETGDECVIER